ncbi:hypothetical protein EPN29_02555 [bacterium]|nr:MAG: hypothetical protein EPN29_02555 [bacterium]
MSLRAEPLTDPVALGDVRSPWLWRALVAASALTFAAVLHLTSYKNFFYDEWDFVTAYRPSQSTSILFPHNEHWSTIPILIWKLLFLLFGIRTHVPYEAMAVAGHVACVLLLFELVRRRSGELPAFATALILLVLGTGASDIVLAFQFTWTLSIAFGLAAMLVIDTSPPSFTWRRVAALLALLLGSLMSSGLGLGFLVAIGVQLLLERDRRLLLVAVAAALGVYLLWFATNGSIGSPCGGCPTALGAIRSTDPGNLLDAARFEGLGLTASVLGLFGLTVFGLPGLLVEAILVAFVGLLVWHWYRHDGVQSWEVGLIAGLLAQFTLVAIVRARLQVVGAADPHYVYVGGVYLLPVAANALKRIPSRPLFRPVMAAAFALIVWSNASLLVQQAQLQQNLMRTENAELRVVELFRGAPDMALDGPLDADIMPQLTAARYYAAIDELGSPVPGSVPTSLDSLPANVVDRQLVALFGSALTVSSDVESAPSPCSGFASSGPSTLDAMVPDGGTILLRADHGISAALSLGVLAPATSRPLLRIGPSSGQAWVHLPKTGKPVVWRLRIRTASSATNLSVCGGAHVQFHTGTSLFSAEAAGGSLDAPWTSTSDSAAYGGLAARLPAATASRARNIFGAPMLVDRGTYDVWYRARVADSSGSAPEMTLGLFDPTHQSWVGGTIYRASTLGTSYRWVKAVTGMVKRSGDPLVFAAEFDPHAGRLGTDWFIDEGVILPAGSPPPVDATPFA